jgi:hypothetical protein
LICPVILTPYINNNKPKSTALTLRDAADTGSTSTVVEFGQIPRKQFDNLKKFFQTQTKVTIKNKANELENFFSKDAAGFDGKKGRGQTILDLGSDHEDDEEEEDSDFEAKPKKKKNKEKSPGGEENDDDDDSDESSGGSGSSSDEDDDDSDMAEELPFDPNELTGIGGGEVEGKRKRQKVSVEGKKKKKEKPMDVSPTRGGGGKKKKDPNAPKAAKTAYSYFMDAKRPELKEQGITDFIEQSKKTSELWKLQTDKSEYERLAEQDKARYNKEMESYVPPEAVDDEPSQHKTSPAKKKRDPNAPKAARNPFNFFAEENRAQAKIGEGGAILGLGETQKKLAAMWNAMSEQDKVKYNDLAKKDKERYAKEMSTYIPPAGLEEPAKKKSSGKPKTQSSSTGAGAATGGGASKKKPKPLAGGELPSSDDDSSSDDSSSDDSSSEDE